MADFTREIEDTSNEAVEAGRRYMAEVVPAMSPHPMGTTKVKPEDAKWDYDNRREDYWGPMAQEKLQRINAEGGNVLTVIVALLKHDVEMRGSDDTR